MLQQRMTALLAFVMPAESGAFRRHVMERFGVAARRLEPRDSRRQLEQQRQELPVSQPQQQQQPGQQEQQHRVPGRPCPSSIVAPAGASADPAAILSGASEFWPANRVSEPPGASRPAELSESSGRDHFSETTN